VVIQARHNPKLLERSNKGKLKGASSDKKMNEFVMIPSVFIK